jgi:DNA-binding CsgD family transcriptional regulator
MMHLHEMGKVTEYRMTDADDRAEPLIEAIYDGIVEMPCWTAFLELACATFDVRVASIIIESNSLGYPEHIRLFSSGATAADIERIDAFSFADIFSDNFREGVCDWTLPSDDGAEAPALGFSAEIQPGIRFAFGLWHRPGNRPFDRASHALCHLLIPHLKRAMRVFVRYAQAFRERSVYLAVIDRIGIGVALVDADAKVLTTNAIGSEILESANGLRVIDGRLTAATPNIARALEHYIRAGAEAQTLPPQERGQPLALERLDKASPLTVIVHPGPGFEPVNAPLRRTAIVVMRDPDRRASVSADVVAQLFGLTPSEAALATLLAQGADLDEAAEQLEIRRNTARSHLQSIFMKTGANRQSELVRTILSSVATLSH